MPSRLDWQNFIYDVFRSIRQAHEQGAVNVQSARGIADDEEFGNRIWLVVGDANAGVHYFEVTENLKLFMEHRPLSIDPRMVEDLRRKFPEVKITEAGDLPVKEPLEIVQDAIWYATRNDRAPPDARYRGPFMVLAWETNPRRPGTEHPGFRQTLPPGEQRDQFDAVFPALPPRPEGIRAPLPGLEAFGDLLAPIRIFRELEEELAR